MICYHRDLIFYYSVSSIGSYDQTTGIWSVGNIANGTSETLLIDVLVNEIGDYTNIAQVTASDNADIDSSPDNDDGDQSEDDEDSEIIIPVALHYRFIFNENGNRW